MKTSAVAKEREFVMHQNPKELAKVIKQYASFSLTEKKALHDNAYQKWQDKFNAKSNYKQFADNLLAVARCL